MNYELWPKTRQPLLSAHSDQSVLESKWTFVSNLKKFPQAAVDITKKMVPTDAPPCNPLASKTYYVDTHKHTHTYCITSLDVTCQTPRQPLSSIRPRRH